MDVFFAVVIALMTVMACTLIHYEVIRVLDQRLRDRGGLLRRHVISVVVVIMVAHLVEIALYAAAFWFISTKLDAGAFTGHKPTNSVDFFALAAESYTSFGYGDIVPTGWLRFAVSLSPINGLLLLAWSGAFLYAAVHQRNNG